MKKETKILNEAAQIKSKNKNHRSFQGKILMQKESPSFTQTFFFLYIQFTLFRTKYLQSPGTYIFKRTWDPSQKAITK